MDARCVYEGCSVARISQSRGDVLLAPVLLPKTAPDTAEGTWAVPPHAKLDWGAM